MTETRVAPLGGLGEVGLNCLAVTADGHTLAVDCGCLFPPSDQPGIDYLIPDLGALFAPGAGLAGVLLTHGHDDHLGAVPHLLRRRPVPVYGTPMTLALLAPRLAERLPEARALLRPVAAGEVVSLGPFRAEFLPVTHSVPGACAVGIESPGGRLLHSGDFKFDPTPVEGVPTDEAALARWGDRGLDLLCCDSTGAATPGRTPSERAVAAPLAAAFGAIPGRVYLATFGSHVHRVAQAIAASRACGRQTVLLGRAVTQAARAARTLGHLRVGPGELVSEPRSRGLPREALTVVLGGSQGEPGSALWRVAHGLEPHHRVRPGDGVIFSARCIPGSEPAIHRLVGRCLARGATVLPHGTPGLHVSGHPGAGDVAHLLALTRPRHLLPVHGEARHLDAVARVAREEGLGPERVWRLANGESLVLAGGAVTRGPVVPSGRVYVEGDGEGRLDDGLLADRRRLGRAGVAVVRVVLLRGGVDGVTVTLRGVVPPAAASAVARAAEAAVRGALGPAGSGTVPEVEAAAEAALRRHFRRENRTPLVLAVAVEFPSPVGDDPRR